MIITKNHQVMPFTKYTRCKHVEETPTETNPFEIRGNEKADRLASTADIASALPPGRAEVLKSLTFFF